MRVSLPDPRELHRMVSRRFRAVGNSTGWFRAGFAQLGTPQDGFAQVSRSWELHRMVSRSLGAVEVIFLNYNIFMTCFFKLNVSSFFK